MTSINLEINSEQISMSFMGIYFKVISPGTNKAHSATNNPNHSGKRHVDRHFYSKQNWKHCENVFTKISDGTFIQDSRSISCNAICVTWSVWQFIVNATLNALGKKVMRYLCGPVYDIDVSIKC